MTARERGGARPRPRIDPSASRRRDEVFGEVLPEGTGDDRDDDGQGSAASRGGADAVTDAWLRENVPPHHG